MGQPEEGQPEEGQPEEGQPEVGQLEVGQLEVGQLEVGQPERGPVEGGPVESPARREPAGRAPAWLGGLELAYRPLADLASSQVIGAEALPRWRWDGTDVPQQEFQAAAETARVTVELGDWMLGESCSQAAAWWRDGWEASLWLRCPPGLPLAPFSESVLGALAGSGLAPAALILEVASPVLADGGEAVLRAAGGAARAGRPAGRGRLRCRVRLPGRAEPPSG